MKNQACRVLVVESDAVLTKSICGHLAGLGIEASGVRDARTLERTLAQGSFDVVVCGVDQPDRSGFSLAARLRQATSGGIVVLTQNARSEDRVLGLSMGADHCLSKPIDLPELGLIVRNLHHRRSAVAAPATAVEWWESASDRASDRVSDSAGIWRFDPVRWTLTTPCGNAVFLAMPEYVVMTHLVGHTGEVVSRDDLRAALGRSHVHAYSRNLDALMCRLRRKVEKPGGERLPILSARNVGYVFTGLSLTTDEPVALRSIAPAPASPPPLHATRPAAPRRAHAHRSVRAA